MFKLLQKSLFKRVEKPSRKLLLSSLAPKILENKEDIKKIQPYLNKLEEALDTEGIRNIALTGGYGSGKSTILKTFKALFEKYQFLNISLASFNNKSNDVNKSNSAESKPSINKLSVKDSTSNKDELERLLEVSILQQIFYHVKQSEIPESRFKRIVNTPNWKIWLISVGFIVWITSCILLLKYDYLDKINPASWKDEYDFDWWALFVFVIACIGIGFFSKLIIQLFNNSKINKVNIKGELELGDKVTKSVFNEHLEEILYFFEKTKYDVILIEDLDRFDSTDIFTKLREINTLLNNYSEIEREIKFVYAVGDDLFGDKKERVKFFEYIIPVIPFINSSNASDQLQNLITQSKLEISIFSKEFLSDLTTFIDDIDMRLLTNIFHEFVIYREMLNPKSIKENNELLAMITYKNIDPQDFTELNNRGGRLYHLINNKNTYVKDFTDDHNAKIEILKKEIQEIENHFVQNLEELKSIYIQAILAKLPSDVYIRRDSLDLDNLIQNQNIPYRSYNMTMHKFPFNFIAIENEVDSDYSYRERVKLTEAKKSQKLQSLKNEIEKHRKAVSSFDRMDIHEIFTKISYEEHFTAFSNNQLVRNLILNGYINENYNDYISLFHGVSITRDDFAFEKNVRSGQNTEFTYKLSSNIETLIARIDDRYYEREAILNFDVVDFLGGKYSIYSEKYDAIIRVLSNESPRSINFIDEYVLNEERPISVFLEKLVKEWKGFWEYIVEDSSYDRVKIDNYLRLILTYVKVDTILEYQDQYFLNEMIESNPKFLSLLKNVHRNDAYLKLATIFKELTTKFHSLDGPTPETQKIFEYVYNNNHYQINKENVALMLSVYDSNFSSDKLQKANYTTIINSGATPLIKYVDASINTYISNVFLKISENVNESEESIILLINNERIDSDSKINLIQHVDTLISDLSKIQGFGAKTVLLRENKVVPNWQNVTDYFSISENKFDEYLIAFLNNSENATALSELKLSKENETFEENLLLCNELSTDTYLKLIKSVYFEYEDLQFDNLDKEKIAGLISVLNLTKEHYDLLREQFPNYHINLIEKNLETFYNDSDQFELDSEDVLLLLKSLKISNVDKLKYISTLNKDIITEDSNLMRAIAKIVLQQNEIIEFDFSTTAALIKAVKLTEDKVRLINLYYDSLENNEIIRVTSSIDSPFGEMFEPRHKPKIPKTDHNRVLLEKLKRSGLIRDFDVDKKDTEVFRVIANY